MTSPLDASSDDAYCTSGAVVRSCVRATSGRSRSTKSCAACQCGSFVQGRLAAAMHSGGLFSFNRTWRASNATPSATPSQADSVRTWHRWAATLAMNPLSNRLATLQDRSQRL